MRDLDTLARAGREKITDRRSLYASDYIQLISDANLRGSDELLELISKVYAIGFEKGYTASQYDTKKKRMTPDNKAKARAKYFELLAEQKKGADNV